MQAEDKENWEEVSSRIDSEGLHYCFEHYSEWEEIEDEEFHKLRLEYIKAAKRLQTYIDKKLK